jgi:hypothetical protein
MRSDGRTVSDFTEFVGQLPAEYEIALTAENVSTAFYRALRAGWSVDQLVGDAAMTLKRGGVGLVVTRMAALSESPPTERSHAAPAPRNVQAIPLPECASCGQPYTRSSRARPGDACVRCGEQLALRQYRYGDST